jgi:hypothetical protein
LLQEVKVERLFDQCIGRQPQTPFGNDRQRHCGLYSDCCFAAEGEMRGSLHYAVHDETVNRFGRDDEFWVASDSGLKIFWDEAEFWVGTELETGI